MLSAEKRVGKLLKVISPPQRLTILRAIGEGEVCVCHLQALFPKWRQAYISQHLRALRKANVLTSRRDGRYVFYRLREPGVLTLLDDAARLTGLALTDPAMADSCGCPHCQPGAHEGARKESL